MDGPKACTMCGETQPRESFHKDAKARDGRRSRCASCVAKVTSEASKTPPIVDPSVTHKDCPRCVRLDRPALHPIDGFGVANRRKDGKNSWCKRCCSEATSEWQRTESGRLKHIEAVKKYNEKRRRSRLSGTTVLCM